MRKVKQYKSSNGHRVTKSLMYSSELNLDISDSKACMPLNCVGQIFHGGSNMPTIE